MLGDLRKLAAGIDSRLRSLGFRHPTLSVIRQLLEVSFLASQRTEEGRMTRASVTFANPVDPEHDPPLTRRADYPAFRRFGRMQELTAPSLTKLSRAVDSWAASIAVFGDYRRGLKIWGVLDQQAQRSVMLYRESSGGFPVPGVLTLNIEGPGDISAVHGRLFLGAFRGNRHIQRESDVLQSAQIKSYLSPFLAPTAQAIERFVPAHDSAISFLRHHWAETVSRLCIGLRRLGTGGAFLITPSPKLQHLDVRYEIAYSRLADSLALRTLDDDMQAYWLKSRIPS